MFQKHKKDFLRKKDKSIKGSVDKKIKDIINIINKNKNYYTTSSCSGRILLLIPGKKKEAKRIFVSHEKIKINKNNINNIKKIINKNINNYKKQNKKIDVHLKQESFILHVRCRDIESAKNLLKITNKIGIRRSGIVSINKINNKNNNDDNVNNKINNINKNKINKNKNNINKNKKIIIEIIGSEHFETIIVKNNNITVDDSYLKIIIDEANKRLENNHEKLNQFYKLLKKEL